MLPLIWLACVAAPETPAGTTPDTEDTTTPPTFPNGPVDTDGDGAYAPEDCDDTDPDVYPGAPEEWDGKDADCDGRVDADGDYAGTVAVSAVAIYEGQEERFQLSCPATLSRGGGVLAVAMVCTPDPEDALAQLLLGETLRLDAEDAQMGGGSWSEGGTLSSSAGWSTAAELSLGWPDLDHVDLTWFVDTRSLDVGGTATLTWDGAG